MIADKDFIVILHILAICVLIDKRERDRELIEFVHCGQTLGRKISPADIISPTELRHWYRSNYVDIKLRLENDNMHLYKKEILSQLKRPKLYKPVLTAMFSIAVCDYDLADEECTFIKLALKTWQTTMPDGTNLFGMN